jgi:hypothetical protein
MEEDIQRDSKEKNPIGLIHSVELFLFPYG